MIRYNKIIITIASPSQIDSLKQPNLWYLHYISNMGYGLNDEYVNYSRHSGAQTSRDITRRPRPYLRLEVPESVLSDSAPEE